MMSEPVFFSVVIVNYNAFEIVQHALDSLKAQTFKDFEVILVDNNSCVGSISDLNFRGLSQFSVLEQDENYGFARANNIAAARARGKWLCLLNPDATARPDWLEEVRAGIMRHPACDVFASCQLRANHPEEIDGAGDSYLIYGFGWRNGFGRPRQELPADDQSCFAPCGASAIYRRELFLDYGGFDERFFCYCEDLDLGLRMQLDGLPCVFLARAIVDHQGSAIVGASSRFQAYHGNRNQLWCLIKNMPVYLLFFSLPFYVAFFLFSYFRNKDSFQHGGMIAGFWAGFWRGWLLRISGGFKRKSIRPPRRRFYRTVAWNPYAYIHQRLHFLDVEE